MRLMLELYKAEPHESSRAYGITDKFLCLGGCNMCLYPKLIRNKKYIANEKNKGRPPIMKDKRTELVPVGCGKCIECMKQKRNEWSVRLLEEIRHDNNATFITLTFSPESLQELGKEIQTADTYLYYNEIATLAVRRFLERWRKKYKKSLKHWLITELGQNNTERIHLHGILWTKDSEEIERIWNYGKTWAGTYVNERTVLYITKYVHKMDVSHKNYKPKILTSAGIGKGFLSRIDASKNIYKGRDTIEYYKSREGRKMALPKYYRNHIYTEEERENLWLNMLDKNVRYVCGEEISIESGEDEYEQTRNYYREINIKLGYGDDSKNWDERQYKNARKILKLKEKYNH